MFLSIYKMNNRKLVWYRRFYGDIIAHLHIPISATFAVTHAWLIACEKNNFWFTSVEGNWLSRLSRSIHGYGSTAVKSAQLEAQFECWAKIMRRRVIFFKSRLWVDQITITSSSFLSFFFISVRHGEALERHNGLRVIEKGWWALISSLFISYGF